MAGYSIVYVTTVRAFIKSLLVYLAALSSPLVTGATISYMDGDDAWWDQEIPFPFGWPRFYNLTQNTLYDRYTGLEWIADPSAIGGNWGTEGFPTEMTWYDAIEECNKLVYGGHNDWRMPNDNELQTITDYGKDHPALQTEKFKNAKNDNYFSGSITNYGCENYFQNDASTGGKTWDQDKEKKKYVRPVRGKLVPWWSPNIEDKAAPYVRVKGRGM